MFNIYYYVFAPIHSFFGLFVELFTMNFADLIAFLNIGGLFHDIGFIDPESVPIIQFYNSITAVTTVINSPFYGGFGSFISGVLSVLLAPSALLIKVVAPLFPFDLLALPAWISLVILFLSNALIFGLIMGISRIARLFIGNGS